MFTNQEQIQIGVAAIAFAYTYVSWQMALVFVIWGVFCVTNWEMFYAGLMLLAAWTAIDRFSKAVRK
jgi:hypothetical protein